MATYPGAAKIRILNSRAVKVTVTRPKPIYSRAYSQVIAQDAVTARVDFPTPTTDAEWILASCMLVNSGDNPDADLVFFQIVGISQPSQSGFDVRFSAPAPTGSFSLHWAIAEKYNP